MKKPEPKPQLKKFIEAARELGCNEDEAAFDEMVKKVAKAPPPRQVAEKVNAPNKGKPKK